MNVRQTAEEIVKKFRCYDPGCSGCKHDVRTIAEALAKYAAATIERCAQIADRMAEEEHADSQEFTKIGLGECASQAGISKTAYLRAGAAIRAMKEAE